MPLRRSVSSLVWFALPVCLAVACSSSKGSKAVDANKDNVADDLGEVVDADDDGVADLIDINGDGKDDGFGVDTDGDGEADALALDTNCDGFFDSIDTSRDGLPDWMTDLESTPADPDCKLPNISGSSGSGGGGSGPVGGSGPMGGSSGKAGSSTGGTGGMSPVDSQLGKAQYQGTGSTQDQYAESDVYRNGVGYMFIANGWGTNWGGHDISYNGTSFTVKSLNGSQGQDYSPAGYPTVFCGLYSKKQSPGGCGLPKAISSIQSIQTGWRWKSNGNNGQYNAAWDIWLGNGTSAESFSSYLMVWLRDPPGQQPAGGAATAGETVPGLPGTWNIWIGDVKGFPIVNYVQAEGNDLSELEFDVMDVYRHAKGKNYSLPGSHILSVAVGFEVWNGPVTNLVSEDFYVDVK